MNCNDLFDIIGETPERYIVDAADFNAKMVPMQKRSTERVWLIAAIVALMLFLMGCAFALFHLDDLVMGEEIIGDHIEGETEDRTVLSLQGIAGSPSYQAAKEWYDFLKTYDPDGKILQSLSNSEMIMPDEYWSYNCYTAEMTAKVDEICGKYGLQKQGVALLSDTEENFYATLHIDRLIRECAQAEVTISPEYFYQTGSFMLSCETKLTGDDSPWKYPIEYQYYCVMKTDFDDVFLSVADMESYEQWQCTSAEGVQILLALSEDKALLIADMENAFVTVNILNPRVGDILYGEQMMTREAMEAFAETFDFSFVPHKISPEDWQAAIDRRDEADAKLNKRNYYTGFRIDLATQTWYPPEGYSDSFDSYIAYIREHASSEHQYYTLMDINGDGTEELLWGTQDGHLFEVAVMQEGEVSLRFDDYLCEGDTLLRENNHDTYIRDGKIVEENCASYEYSTLSATIVKLYYLPATDQWIETSTGQDDRVITEAEAEQIMDQFPITELDMKPISEYPLL